MKDFSFCCQINIKYLILILIGMFFLNPSGLKANHENFKVIKIRQGDSISYLSFKMYKKFNDHIINALIEVNPGLNNINKIIVGQQIRFPSLEYINNFERKFVDFKAKDSVKQNTETGFKKEKVVEALEESKTKNENAYLTLVQGIVYVCYSGKKDHEAIEPNAKLSEGDEVKVGEQSKAEIITFDNDIIRLSEKSTLKITKMESQPEENVQKKGLFMSIGRMWNSAKKLVNPNSEYVVKTPNAISGIKGTSYTIDINETGNTRFKTYAGSVKIWRLPENSMDIKGQSRAPVPIQGPHQVSMEEWKEILIQMNQEVNIPKVGAPKKGSFDPVADEKTDEWVKWNMNRDREMNDKTFKE